MSTLFIFDHGYNDKNLCLNTRTGEMFVIPVADWKRLNIPGIQAGDRIATENAHVLPRTRKSMSQPCTHEENLEIQRIAQVRGIEIRTMSQQQTASLRTKYVEDIDADYGKYVHLLEEAQQKQPKNEVRDILAWHFHLLEHPDFFEGFKVFDPQTQDSHETASTPIWDARDGLNLDLNAARTGGPKLCYRHNDDVISDWIKANVETLEAELTEEQLSVLDWKVTNRGKPTQYVADKPQKRLYTLIATIVQSNGEWRVRPDNGEMPFWSYVKQVFFGMTPYHDNAGVAASNVKWWWRMFRSPFPKGAVHRHADDQGFRDGRSYMDKQIRDIWRTIRQLVINSSNNGRLIVG